MNLFFDTETTGLPQKGTSWETNYMNFPYIVQLSWKNSDEEKVHDFIIKPDNYFIPPSATKIHGISHEMALQKGLSFQRVVNLFIHDALKAEKIIGHNIYFDTSVIKANVLRMVKNNPDMEVYKWTERTNEALHKTKRFDTMMKTIKFCNIRHKNGRGIKWPTLLELHKKLFSYEFDAHNSKEDVLATERCYNKLVQIGIV